MRYSLSTEKQRTLRLHWDFPQRKGGWQFHWAPWPRCLAWSAAPSISKELDRQIWEENRACAYIYIYKRKLLSLTPFHRCQWEGFRWNQKKTRAWSPKIKCYDESKLRAFQNRKQNALVVFKCQRNPHVTRNRGEQFKKGETKQTKTILGPRESGWTDLLIPFCLLPPFYLWSSPANLPPNI